MLQCGGGEGVVCMSGSVCVTSWLGLVVLRVVLVEVISVVVH